MPRRGVALPVHLLLIAGIVSGCGDGGAGAPDATPAAAAAAESVELRGERLAAPLRRPDFTLTDTHGERFDFRSRTAGRLTLLYFGYTHCPDVCPVHMANIAAVLAEMRPEVVRATRVVFVTVDPERDTPARLRSWLDQFDPDFVGLRGTEREVRRIERELGLPPTIPDSSAAGDGGIGHAAQVIAFTPDGFSHVVYPFGTRQQDWAHDLPLLLSLYPGGDRAGS